LGDSSLLKPMSAIAWLKQLGFAQKSSDQPRGSRQNLKGKDAIQA
jgi:hypothetical protein